MKAKIITPSCFFDCEMVIGPDVTLEAQEIRKIYDESIRLVYNNHAQYISISDFRNNDGQTIGEYLLEKKESFAVALSQEGE